jgi:NAD(P)-dependent dehydrogenase (short-subunit alcohol dehydrogenase family)
MGVKQLFDLRDRVAIVTGGSRGLGLSMAQALGDMGARVALVARKADELETARTLLAGHGVDCFVVAGDLAAAATSPRVVDAVMKQWGQIDILVNNAGANWAAPAEDYPDDGWRKVMALNVDAQFALSREVGKRSMIPRRAGKIINIASIAGLFGNPPAWNMQTIAYNTSKGALVNFTRALAAEWGRHNINVNAICPGFFPSKMTKATLERIDRAVIDLTPLGRLGNDDDLQGAVVFLASEASRHVTGQALVVDGGCTIV